MMKIQAFNEPKHDKKRVKGGTKGDKADARMNPLND